MLNRLRHFRYVCDTRHALLIALMALTLVGVQLAQSSPLHHHARHSVDCALCHLQLSDDVLVRYQFTPTFIPATSSKTAVPPQFYAFASPSPYQGRAPPRLFA